MADKPLLWAGSSLADMRAFPAEARRMGGYQLRRVQSGLMPSDWKPMPSVGSGVNEIRIHTTVEHRVIYVAKFEEAVYVLHAFEKKSRKTPVAELATAVKRLAEVRRLRQTGKEL